MFNVLTKIIHFINNQKKKEENISFQRFPTVVILLIVHIKIRILLFSGTDDTDLHGTLPLPNEAFAYLDDTVTPSPYKIRVIPSAGGYGNTRT